MFDVFDDETETLIKDGIANLYWYRKDLLKAWRRSGVNEQLANIIFIQKDPEGKNISKRKMMDLLYDQLRTADYNRRLEISRNFARLLIEHRSFVPQDANHRVERAEMAALKLREILQKQQQAKQQHESARKRVDAGSQESYDARLLELRGDFERYNGLPAQRKGYALEALFSKLMQISGIADQKSFKIVGEQIDGGIKYEGHYYLVELKWTQDQVGPGDVGNFYYKVDGKMDKRGILLSMNGFTPGVIESITRGRDVMILLLDGVHLANVLYGVYTFPELLEHSLEHAAYRSQVYCPHSIAT